MSSVLAFVLAHPALIMSVLTAMAGAKIAMAKYGPAIAGVSQRLAHVLDAVASVLTFLGRLGLSIAGAFLNSPHPAAGAPAPVLELVPPGVDPGGEGPAPADATTGIRESRKPSGPAGFVRIRTLAFVALCTVLGPAVPAGLHGCAGGSAAALATGTVFVRMGGRAVDYTCDVLRPAIRRGLQDLGLIVDPDGGTAIPVALEPSDAGASSADASAHE